MQQKLSQKKPFFKPVFSSDWLKNKAAEQKKSVAIKQIQFHGSRHRG